MSEAVGTTEAEAAPRRLTTVVAADICGYSRLAEIDDDAAIRTVAFVRSAFERVVAHRRGRVFHTAGDGFLAEFPSAADGVLAAVEFVADIKARDKLSPINPGAQVRAGVHAGDVIERPDGDLLGHGVNVASRLQAEADPNGVLISLAAVNLVRGSVDVQFSRRGALALRNIEEPVVAFDARRIVDGHGSFLKLLRVSRFRSMGFLAATAAGLAIALSALSIWSITQARTIAAETMKIETARSAALEVEAASLRNQIFGDQNPASDELGLIAVTEAAESLARSGSAEKRVARDLIKDGKLDEALQILEGVHQRETSSNPNSEAAQLALKEAGPLAVRVDTKKAISIYSKLYLLTPDDPIVLYQLGRLTATQNNFEDSGAYFRAMEISAKSDAKMRIRAKVGLIESEIAQRNLDGIEPMLLQTLRASQNLGLAAEEAAVLSALAKYWDFSENVLKAISYQSRALIIERALGQDHRLLSAEKNYGAMLLEAKRFEEAEMILKAALVRSRALQDQAAEGSILLNLSYACLETGKPGDAYAVAKSALEIANRAGRPNLKALSTEALTMAAAQMNDQTTACRHYGEMMEAFSAEDLEQPLPFYRDHSAIGCKFASRDIGR